VPAAAVIPAPIAYIKVVAVKKLVVEFLIMDVSVSGAFVVIHMRTFLGLHWSVGGSCTLL
jgi:hypothetical protein